jgi:hypothetical protein
MSDYKFRPRNKQNYVPQSNHRMGDLKNNEDLQEYIGNRARTSERYSNLPHHRNSQDRHNNRSRLPSEYQIDPKVNYHPDTNDILETNGKKYINRNNGNNRGNDRNRGGSANNILTDSGLGLVTEFDRDTVTKTHTVIIDTSNRDLENESRFNFSLKFAPTGTEFVKYPIYENNATLPQSDIQRDAGIRGDPNSEGWEDSGGNIYKAYDSSQPHGQIIGYDFIKFIGDDVGCYINRDFKNVKSIAIEKILLPDVKMYHPLDRSIGYTLREVKPLLLVYIPELGSNYNSTNNDIELAHTILTPYKNNSFTLTSSTATTYLEYMPFSENIKEFIPEKNDLSRLTFRLCFENNKLGDLDMLDGNITGNYLTQYMSKDIYTIEDIEEDDANKMIKITTTQYFGDWFFKVKSNVVFKNFTLVNKNIDTYDTEGEMRIDTGDMDLFNKFMSDTEHMIIKMGSLNSDGFTNVFYISAPIKMNSVLGCYFNVGYYERIKTYINQEDIVNTTSKCLNSNMQLKVVLKVTTSEPNLKKII